MDLAYIAPGHVRCVHDTSLLRTLPAYREALNVLQEHGHPTELALKMQLAQAVEQVENELRRRARHPQA